MHRSVSIVISEIIKTSNNDTSFEWEGRQLIEYSSDCHDVSYRYNDQGIRTQKVVTTCEGSTTIDYVLDGDHVLVETHSNGITLAYTYDVDGSLLSMNYNGTDYFYVTNLQGDILELLDSQGTRVVSYEYDAWGNILYQTGGVLAELNPYRYRGYRYDSETDYYYLQSRYYDPSIGRFISSDGLVGEVGNLLSHNMYAYGANNPANQRQNAAYLSSFTSQIYSSRNISTQETNNGIESPRLDNKYTYNCFAPIHISLGYNPSLTGEGRARALFFDLTGPTIDRNGFVLVDSSTGFVDFETMYNDWGWGVSLFQANAFLGATTDKAGFDINAYIFGIKGFVRIDDTLRIGAGVTFLSVGYAAKYYDGKVVLKAGFGYFGIEIIIEYEE